MTKPTRCPWTTRQADGTVLLGIPPYQAMILTTSAAVVRAATWALRIGRTETCTALAHEATRLRWTESGRA